jgi:hypothetical protein
MAAGLFKKSTNPKNSSRSVVRNVTAESLENDSPGASADIWTKDPIGTGLKNTQQLLVDWSDYTRHVFFNSAEAKVNLAFDQIVNEAAKYRYRRSPPTPQTHSPLFVV